MTKCPKCGRDAWVVRVQRQGFDTSTIVDGSAKRVTYLYDDYRHYAGSKKTITLTTLAAIVKLYPLDLVMEQAKKRAGSKVVHHYVRVKG